MVSPDEIADLLPDRPIKPDELERLTNVSGIDRADPCAGGSHGEHAIVLAGGEWMIGLSYTDQWEVVGTISGECSQDEVTDLMNRTAMY